MILRRATGVAVRTSAGAELSQQAIDSSNRSRGVATPWLLAINRHSTHWLRCLIIPATAPLATAPLPHLCIISVRGFSIYPCDMGEAE
jgi:hypothetical protein